MKEVWGKGDKVHVLDNFNANDFSDFIFPDYIDRRLGEVMFKATANLSWDYNLKLEGIYTPWMTPDRFATSGKFVPNKQKGITSRVTNAAMKNYSEYLMAVKEADVMASVASTWKSEYEIASKKAELLASAGKTSSDDYTSAKAAADAAAGKLLAMATQTASTGALDSYLNSMFGDKTSVIVAGVKDAQSAVLLTDDMAKAAIALGQADAGIAKATDNKITSTYKDGKNIYERYITDTVTYVNTQQTLALSNMSSLNSNGDALYPNTRTLRYGQAGVRLTGTLAGIDWGTSYYYGHYKQPSFNAGKLTTYMQKYLANQTIEDDDKFLQYDQLQVFGLEAAFVLWKLNTRW